MEKELYEKMLKAEPEDYGMVEAFWDNRAQEFNQNQQKEKTGFISGILTLLKEKGIFPGSEILDVGGGSGRYAIPFAENTRHVTVTDISSNMLALTEKNALEAGLHNLECRKLEWSGADIQALGWEKKFDLVFASMCPAIRNKRGFENMSLASGNYCLLNQFIKDTDSASQYLDQVLSVKRNSGPHNDRQSVQAFFNLLWLNGFNPEITYLHLDEDLELDYADAVKHYGLQYREYLENIDKTVDEFLKPLEYENKLKIKRQKTTALILWKVQA